LVHGYYDRDAGNSKVSYRTIQWIRCFTGFEKERYTEDDQRIISDRTFSRIHSLNGVEKEDGSASASSGLSSIGPLGLDTSYRRVVVVKYVVANSITDWNMVIPRQR
jgi:hypothetical protein